MGLDRILGDPMTAPSLIERLEGAERGNALDIQIEIALFKPDAEYLSVRPNDAGTKLIYTKADGSQQTCWAFDWTMPSCVAETIKQLRARKDTL